jgi:hypothetical protein
MADSVEMQDIRGLDIDKAVKGFALTEFVFKNELCIISQLSGDSIRWFQETNTDLTATAPSAVANISPLSIFPTLEPTWTRNTSYVKKYGAECTISIEDIKSAEIPVLSRTMLRLTRAVAKQVDTDIWNVITESQSPSTINTTAATAAWDAASGQDPVEDILECLQEIEEAGYNTDSAVILLSPKDKKSLLAWCVTTNGADAPQFSSKIMEGGDVTRILGKRVITNINVTADYAAVVVPKVCATFMQHTPLTSRIIVDEGISNKIRVWENGITLLTDPKAVSLLTNTQA